MCFQGHDPNGVKSRASDVKEGKLSVWVLGDGSRARTPDRVEWRRQGFFDSRSGERPLWMAAGRERTDGAIQDDLVAYDVPHDVDPKWSPNSGVHRSVIIGENMRV